MVLDLETGDQVYVGGEFCVWEGVDSDSLNIFGLEGMSNAHGYGKFINIWYRNTQVPNNEFEAIKIEGDNDIRHMIILARLNQGELEVFFEQHPHCFPLQTILEGADDEMADDEPVGVDGDEGYEGDEGSDGNEGFHDREGVLGAEGYEGDEGYEGYEGDVGEDGDEGFHGDQGVDGEVVDEAEVVHDETPHFTQEDIYAVMADITVEEQSNGQRNRQAQETKRGKRKLVIDSSETDSDSDEGGPAHNPSSTDPLFVQPTVWSCEEGSLNYHSEELGSPVSSGEDGLQSGTTRNVFPQFTEGAEFGQVVLELGMEFPDLITFKEAVRDYNINLGRNFRWSKNEKDRARVVCSEKGCPWKIHCSWSKSPRSFQVVTFDDDHKCSRQFRNKQAKTKWVSKKLQLRLRTQPELSHSEAFNYMRETFEVYLDDTKIYRSLKMARKAIEGCEAEQYGKLWDYAHELKRSNPGSTVLMDTTPIDGSNPQFKRIYISLDACKRGFKAGCRPLIGLDGCFLKGYYGGQLLSAVGQDANNHIYVIAYAIVDVEDKENWLWFLTNLHADL